MKATELDSAPDPITYICVFFLFDWLLPMCLNSKTCKIPWDFQRSVNLWCLHTAWLPQTQAINEGGLQILRHDIFAHLKYPCTKSVSLYILQFVLNANGGFGLWVHRWSKIQLNLMTIAIDFRAPGIEWNGKIKTHAATPTQLETWDKKLMIMLFVID